MASYNRVILVGNLTADPELKQTNGGVSVCSFSLAVNRKVKNEGQETVDYIDIVTWRNTAEFVSKYLKKGNSILVSGTLQTRSWTDKQGNKRRSVEVQADEVISLSFGAKKQTETEDYPTPTTTAVDSGWHNVTTDLGIPF